MQSVDVSVIICTWNRAQLLQKSLASLRDMKVSQKLRWEVLVVDNGSTDQTRAVVERYYDCLPVRYALESMSGVAHARNRGVADACGDLLVYADDDVLVNPTWLSEYWEAASRWPNAAFFGGRIDPLFEKEPNAELKAAFPALASGFCGLDLGPREREILPSENCFKSANTAFRRKAMAGLSFNPELGPKGNVWTGGEEHEMYSSLLARGYPGVWVPTAIVRHFVPTSRCTREYLRIFHRGLGMTLVRTNEVPSGRTVAGVPTWILRRYGEVLVDRAVRTLLRDKVNSYRALANQWRLEGIIREFRRLAVPSKDSFTHP